MKLCLRSHKNKDNRNYMHILIMKHEYGFLAYIDLLYNLMLVWTLNT